MGFLEILLGQEPVDACYKFFAKYGLFSKDWDFKSVFQQICSLPGVEGTCRRQEALVYYKKNAKVDGMEIGDILVWQKEEVIDVLYRKRVEHNLTVKQQMKLFGEICGQADVHCKRSRAAVYKQVVNKEDFEGEYEHGKGNSTCPRKYCGWR